MAAPESNKEAGLTDMQRRFCMELLSDPEGNRTQAAIRAGYEAKSAKATAAKLMQLRQVKHFLAERREDLEMATQITQERIIARLGHIAFGDIGDVATWDKQTVLLRQSVKMSPRAKSLISSISGASKNGGVKVKLHDSLTALKMLAVIYGLDVNDGGSGKTEVKGFEVIERDPVKAAEAEAAARAEGEGTSTFGEMADLEDGETAPAGNPLGFD